LAIGAFKVLVVCGLEYFAFPVFLLRFVVVALGFFICPNQIPQDILPHILAVIIEWV